MKGSDRKFLQEFELHCQKVLEATSSAIKRNESVAEQNLRKSRALKSYKVFFESYFPHYCDGGKTACAPYHIRTAHQLANHQVITQIRAWHRGAAKSTHSNIGNPLWLMLKGQMKFMVLMGFNEDKAFRLISDIQAELQHNQLLTHDWGEQFYFGDWSSGDFLTRSGTRFMGISMLQDPSGLRNGPYRIDLAVADDLDNRKKARNRVLVREAVENITGALREGMSKDTQRLIIAQNWKVRGGILDMLIDEIKEQPATKISVVNAVDKNGDPTWSRYTREYWQQKRLNTTIRTWEREYMNNPIEDGNIFKAEWIQWKKCLPCREYDSIVVYGDLSYEAEGDFKALVVVGKTGRELHLIDCFVHQCTIGAAVKWVYSFYRQHLRDLSNARLYYEGNAIQASLFREQFDREGDEQGWYVPMVADTRSKGNKFDRIEKMSAVFERLQFWLNQSEQGNSNFKTLLDQLLAFEKGSGAHDDAPDALEGAIYFINQSDRKSSDYRIKKRLGPRRRL